MADKGTENSGNVASCEGDNQLSLFAHLVSRGRDHVLVEELHCSFKRCKLHHGVRDLAQPQWRQALVEPDTTAESETGETRVRDLPCQAFFFVEFWSALPEGVAPADTCLDSDLYSLHGRESNVGKELGTSTGSQVEHGTIRVRLFLCIERGYK